MSVIFNHDHADLLDLLEGLLKRTDVKDRKSKAERLLREERLPSASTARASLDLMVTHGRTQPFAVMHVAAQVSCAMNFMSDGLFGTASILYAILRQASGSHAPIPLING